MLNALKTYADKNGMTINTKKTQTIIFNKSGHHIRRNFNVGKDKLDSTREYKYLGFMVTPSGEIGTGLKDLKNRALRALSKLKKKMGIYFRKYPTITLKLFRSLIEPILLYASDFWGVLKMPNNNPVENLFMSFCKQLLGVQKQTSNVGVLLELGQIPLMILAQKSCIKNWVRIATNTKCNELVSDSYCTSILENLTWSLNIKNKLSMIGLGDSFYNKDKDSHAKATQRMADMFHQDSFSDIRRDDSKLRTYSLIKNEPGYETYLSEIVSIKARTALTKLRLSNSSLMIEKGRHSKVDKSLRFCPFCPNIVEDEKHFLLGCPTFKYLRSEMYEEVKTKSPTICNKPHCYRFRILLSGEYAAPVSNFVMRAMELREFIMAKHKTRD
jgi:hypothetical protein